MSSFIGSKGESHTYQTQAMPASLDSNASPQAIRASVRQVQVAPTTGTQSSNGVMLFQIPPSKSVISRKSLFLRARINIATSTAPTWATDITSLSLAGIGPLVAPQLPASGSSGSAFVPQIANAYSIIQRLTLFSGSGVLEQINFVNDLMNLQLAHATNPEFLKNDGAMLMAVGQASYSTSASVQYYDVSLPLPFSAFNGVQDFPLHLLGGTPLSLQIDLSSTARALFAGSTVSATEFTVANSYLCYEAVDLPQEVCDSFAMRVKSEPFVLPTSSYLNIQVPISTLSSYSLGLNASSVRGVYVLPFTGSSYAIGTVKSYSRGNATDAITNWGSGMNAQLFLDGRLINSSNIDTPNMTFAMLKSALNNGVSLTQHPSLSTEYNYRTNTFAIGIDSTAFSDESTIFAGQPCSTLTISLTGYTTNSNYLATLCVNYDTLLVFSEGGVVSVKR